MMITFNILVASLQALLVTQEQKNPDRLLSPIFPPVKTLKQVRQTPVDSSNKALWSIVTILREFFTRQLHVTGMPSNILQSVPDKSVLLATTFMCAHDTFSDSGVQLSPHLVADCTDVSKQLADVIAKHTMQDNEEHRPYELSALNAEKAAQKAAKRLAKAKKAVVAAAKKVKLINEKIVKSGSNAPAKAKQTKLLVKAQKADDDAKISFKKASKAAAEASKKAVDASRKAAVVLNIQSDIIQRWQNAIANMKPAALCTGDDIAFPACTESCQLYLAPCAKGKGSKSKCT